jgi:hypothetical protein
VRLRFGCYKQQREPSISRCPRLLLPDKGSRASVASPTQSPAAHGSGQQCDRRGAWLDGFLVRRRARATRGRPWNGLLLWGELALLS